MSERTGSRRAFLSLGLKAVAVTVPVVAAVMAQPKEAKAQGPVEYRRYRRRWWRW